MPRSKAPKMEGPDEGKRDRETPDAGRFSRIVSDALIRETGANGIGTLSEKTLHAVLKDYFAPDHKMQEIRLSGYVADIFTGVEIIEIQTRDFNKLRGKLSAFLPEYPVTVVYPIPYEKRLLWLDPETGECSKERLSPAKGKPQLVFKELYRIRPFLEHPNFRLLICMLNLREYRLLNGWGNGGKRGSSRFDRVPESIEALYRVDAPEEYAQFVPDTLDEPFTSKDYAKACRITQARASQALLILTELGIVKRVGKKGNAYLYTRS